jgi:hypothetical protein
MNSLARFAVPLLLLALAGSPVIAQEKSDRVKFVDRARGVETIRNGTIEKEDPARVVLLSGANRARLEISTADVLEVNYDGEPAELGTARVAERNRQLEQALAVYQEQARKVPAAQANLRAAVQFKVAELRAQLSEGAAGASRAGAIEEVRKFLRDFPESRHALSAWDLWARLRLLEGQSLDEGLAAVRGLRGKFGTTNDFAGRCDAFEIYYLLQQAQEQSKAKPDDAAKLFGAARERLEALAKNADASAAVELRAALAVCRAMTGQREAALKELDEQLKTADTPRARATIHLGRADCQRLTGQGREALWDYLWVDTVYNQDREQQAKAVFYLGELFEKLGDAPKAKEARERLANDVRLKDTRYGRLAK